MAEQVQTGGLVRFDYQGRPPRELSNERKVEIREAYKQAEEREKRDRKNKLLLWLIIALIVVSGIIYLILR